MNKSTISNLSKVLGVLSFFLTSGLQIVNSFLASPKPSNHNSVGPSISALSILWRDNGKISNHREASKGITCLSAEKKYPMIIVGNRNAALGAAMALCARELLIKKEMEGRPSIPPPQLVAFFEQQNEEGLSSGNDLCLQKALLFDQYRGSTASPGPSVDEYRQILGNVQQFLSCIYENESEYGNPILHSSIGDSSNVDSINAIRDSLAFLGFNVKTCLTMADDGKSFCPEYEAIQAANQLQQFFEGSHIPIAVTMDLATHLAMLQTNVLPKSRGLLAAVPNKDVWAIRDTILNGVNIDNGDTMLFEYQYDYDNPFGGTDPLSCPSNAFIIASQSSNSYDNLQKMKINDAHAAAYSAMRGSRSDPFASICVASAVKTVFLQEGKFTTDPASGITTFSPPEYTWDVIDKIADYSITSRRSIEQENGGPRKKYWEFGYK